MRPKANNSLANIMTETTALFEAVLTEGVAGDENDELNEFVATGHERLDPLRRYLHGEIDRSALDRSGNLDWGDRATKIRKEMSKRIISGWTGMGSVSLVDVVVHGVRAPATVVHAHDTGVEVNTAIRVEATFRVEPDGEEPFTLDQRVMVPRTQALRAGDRVEVAYRPDDLDELAYRHPVSTDSPAPPEDAQPNRVDALKDLAGLLDRGLLSPEQFEAEKNRLLEG
jgi:hypothetical protein